MGTTKRTRRVAAASIAAPLLLALACDRGGAPPAATPAAAVAEPPAPEVPAHRNVVLVTIDTLRADALGCYGNRRGASPTLDRLAAEGVLFEDCSSSSPSTLPSHASILTGKQPYSHGVRANGRYQLAPENVTLAERLQDAGYATGAETAAPVLSRRTRIGQGFEHYRDADATDAQIQAIRVDGKGAREQEVHTRLASDITRRGVEYLRRHRGEPFFLWLHYFDPHQPYTPPPALRARFRDAPYLAEVAHVDENVARVVAELERTGLGAHTLLVVTSDHGEGLGEHGENTHSEFVYQTTIQVPLILWGPPDLPRGLRVAEPVRSVDIAPTVLEWLGLSPLASAEGASLLPLVRRQPEAARRTAYGESIELRDRFGTSPLRFVREGSWKYVHKVRPELYDLDRDPGELEDRIAAEPERGAALRARLAELLAAARPVSEDAALEVDETTSAQLAQLGYAVGGPARAFRDELATFGPDAVDPVDVIEDTQRFNDALYKLTVGDGVAALAGFQALAERYPDSSQVNEGILDAHLQLGDAEGALAALRRGIEIEPEFTRYWLNLSELLMLRGEDREARAVLQTTLERWPCDAVSRARLAGLARKSGGAAAQIAVLRAGAAACDDPPELLNDLAYLLATAPDPALRDGEAAVAMAERAVAGLGEQPSVLDTLAAAYAEAGRMEEARQTARKALRLAAAHELPAALQRALESHAEALEAGQPIRD